jgi:1-acyl-sn-glycerol-3-phosphate acyltransferase
MIRSILFTTLMFLSVPPYALACILVRPFGTRVSFAVAAAWARLIDRLARAICGLGYVVEGAGNLPAEPAIAMIKHSSAYETIATLLLLPWQCWVLKRELMWAPFFGWGLATLHPIAIDRNAGRSAVEQIVEQGRQRLAEGAWITIFPEGTRMRAGETRRYGVSGPLLAQASGRPLVPIAHDAGDFWPRRGLRKRAGTVRFVIGEPVYVAGRDPREVNEQIQRWVEDTVARLRAGNGHAPVPAAASSAARDEPLTRRGSPP